MKRYDIHGCLVVETNMARVEIPEELRTEEPVGPDIRILEGELDIESGPLRPLGLRLFVGDGVLVHKCLSYGDLRLIIKDLPGRRGPTEIMFNRAYRFFRELAMGKSIWHFLKLVIMTRLVAAGLTFVHSSGVATGGRAFLFTGWSDVGKTATAIGLVRAGGGEVAYMAGDITVVGRGGAVFGWPIVPRRMVARPFEKIPLLRNIIIRGEPLLPPEARKELRAKISHIFFLSPGPRGKPRELDEEAALKKLVLATDMSFNFASDLLLLAYSYADPSFDILSLREEHIGILRELVSRAECVELRAPGPRGFIEQARLFLG